MKRLFTAGVLLLAVGCSSYTSKMHDSRDLFYDGRYEEALSGLNELLSEAAGNDYYLYRLERGRVNLALGKYDSAVVDLSSPEERFSDIEGTISISEAITSTLLHPGWGEYQPENHEKMLISSYLLLAYWEQGDREGAFVERNRIVGKLGTYINGLSEEDRDKLDVPFARYLSALLYEVQGMEDDARIEYNRIGQLQPAAAPPAVNPHLTELAVFIEIGRVPVKVSREIRGYFQREHGSLQSVFLFPDAAAPLVFHTGAAHGFSPDRLGVIFTFSFPQLIRQERRIHACRAVVDGIEAGEAVLLDDLEETADTAYRKKLGVVLVKAAVRTYLKTVAQTKLKDKAGGAVDVLGKIFSIVDKADTRSWQMLPAEVHLYRLETTPGEHEVQIEYLNERGEVIAVSERRAIMVEEGGKGIVYFPSGLAGVE